MVTRLVFAALLGSLLAAPAWAQSNNPDFNLNNRGNVVINEVYVSSSGVSSWGNDRLGQNVLAPGNRVSIVLPAGQCMNDIRVVYANGQSSERRQVNTCNLTEVNFP
jgi:archaellum component FlaF (FlaF/FlaG flagellin family)